MTRSTALIAFVVSLAGTGRAPAQQSALWRTGASDTVTLFSPTRLGDVWCTTARESDLHADVNGDGDLGDFVLLQLDPATRQRLVTPVAAADFWMWQRFGTQLFPTWGVISGDWQLVPLSEHAQTRVDIDNDGDLFGFQLGVWRFSTGSLAPLLVSGNGDPPWSRSDCTKPVCMIREGDPQGDLNGDGDRIDTHLIQIDLQSATWSVIVPNAWVSWFDGHLFANGDFSFRRAESDVGVDLNGDGDLLDAVCQVHRLASGATTTIPFALDPLSNLNVIEDDRFYLLTVDEHAQGKDVNGDGDALDHVAVVIDAATLQPVATGIAGRPFESAERWFVLSGEWDGGTDWNGDGDLQDKVLFELDPSSGAWINRRVPNGSWNSLAIGDDFVVTDRVESQLNPPADLNGDGDIWDRVPIVQRFGGGIEFPIPVSLELHPPLGYPPYQAVGSEVLMRVFEGLPDFTDFNFDGDTQDSVLLAFDVPTRRVLNIARSIGKGGAPRVSGRRAGIMTSEADEGGRSWNGDDDAIDVVSSFWDADAHSLFETGIESIVDQEDGHGTFALSSFEKSQGEDLDGDGFVEAEYSVLLYTPTPYGCGRFDLYGQGCPTSAGHTPQLEATGCAVPGGSIREQIHGGIAGHPAFIALGAQAASIPLTGGCTLLASPLLPTLVGPIALNANGVLFGAALMTMTLPETAPTGTIRAQAFVSDPGSTRGYAASNGLEIQIAP